MSVSKNNKKASGNDSKFFSSSTRKGENHEIREDLRSPNRDKKRDAVKKVIANMTVGKDVSNLFSDVVVCIQTDNLELKKLVYLYLINYAKSQPDLALMAVNTFVKDANDPNALIRALAIRTMGCIRVEKITEYLCEPLGRCLRDEDPYVRKTAAVCVAKLHDISPDLVEERGFLDILRDLLSDANPTVVANAVAALSEISDASGRDVLQVNASILQKLLAALNECSEWGQVFLLDSLAKYDAVESREAEGIIERVTPRLQHSNSAVVMSAVKVILHFIEAVTNPETLRALYKKLAPPLITLLNSEPEIQYVALRNINLVVLKHPKILEHEIKVFFCKYNDPIYVKMEKLEIIIRLASEKNLDQVLLELKEYATEVDVDFVRRAVRAIGRCAIKLDKSADRCVTVLLDLIQTKVNYVVQEAIVVLKDIFRKYPNRYEGTIATLCDNLDSLDEPEAKASMIWILGEYTDRIEHVEELLESFVEGFVDETAVVQLQLLTASVKLFLAQPEVGGELVQRVLKMASEESDNPDLRDRGFIYWRLLSTDPEAARAVVTADKPEIGDDSVAMEPALLDDLISQIASLASIYHKPPEAFVMKSPFASGSGANGDNDDDEEDGDVIDIDGSGETSEPTATNVSPSTASAPRGGDLLDLLDAPAPAPAPAVSSMPPAAPAKNDILDLFGSVPSTPAVSAPAVKMPTLVTSETGHGIFINGQMKKSNGNIVIDMEIGNSTTTPVQQLAIQFNKNIYGLAPQPTIQLSTPIANGSTSFVSLPLHVNPASVNPADTASVLQAAIKNTSTGAVFFFGIPIHIEALLTPHQMDVQSFANAWKAFPEAQDVSIIVNDLPSIDFEVIKGKMSPHDVGFVVRRDIPGADAYSALYFVAKTISNVVVYLEMKFKPGMNLTKLTVRSPNKMVSEHMKISIAKLLK